MNYNTTQILVNITQHSKKAFSMFTLILFLFLSFLLVSTQSSMSQLVEFDFMFGSFGEGAGQFNSPYGIAVDNMKNIYVADSRNHRIQVFDSAGNFLFMFGWGVNDGTSGFQICTSADTPCQAGINGGGAGQFWNDIGIAVDSMKNMYVADSANRRIQVFDSAGNFLFMFGWGVNDGTSGFQICTSADTPCQAGINGGGVGQFAFPVGIAVDSMKNMYVSEFSNHRIQVFSQSQDPPPQDPPIIRTPIPTLSEWSLIAMSGVLGIISFMVIRRKKASA